MRILVFSERLIPPADEGIKKLALSLAAALGDLGHDVLVLTTDGATWPGGEVTDLPADRLLRSRPLAERLCSFRPEATLYVPTASLTLASGLRARTLKRYAAGVGVALIATQGRRHSRWVRWLARGSRPTCASPFPARPHGRRLAWGGRPSARRRV